MGGWENFERTGSELYLVDQSITLALAQEENLQRRLHDSLPANECGGIWRILPVFDRIGSCGKVIRSLQTRAVNPIVDRCARL